MKNNTYLLVLLVAMFFVACDSQETNTTTETKTEVMAVNPYEVEVKKYFEYELNSDLSHLSDNQREMIGILFEVSNIIDDLFWDVACGPYRSIYDTLTDEYAKELFTINYGPWDRLGGDKSFIDGVGAKPLGAFFYPEDITKEEFESFDNPEKSGLYSIIKRTDDGTLEVIPYHEAFKDKLQKASELLHKASELAEDAGFKKYLSLRAEALLTDDYFESDMAWMDMKDNKIEFVVGPIENYEDQLFEYKTAFEAYVLIKDLKWSERLAKYAKLLPELQTNLPVPAEYKAEKPGSNSQLNAYDVILYAGDCNAGSKTIAINLPNDEKVQLAKGSRRLQLKNAMKAKFDSIVVPIANILISEDLRKNVTFDAFFSNTMFHEVAHGLGIKNTLDNSSTCREALKDRYSSFEEGKADILGLWLINQLLQKNEYETNFVENQVTFMTSIFRSIRFGASSAHGKANLIRYNFYLEQGAMIRSEEGIYSIDFEKMDQATDSLARLIITIQGDGDYAKAGEIMDKYMIETDDLKTDLKKLSDANIPVDVKWIQGKL